jgi:5-methylcytosine-specific restriction endonuclease McrA
MAREAMAQGRAKPLCRRCGKNAGTDVHHRTYDRFGKEKLRDLELVCKTCHGKIHAQR